MNTQTYQNFSGYLSEDQVKQLQSPNTKNIQYQGIAGSWLGSPVPVEDPIVTAKHWLEGARWHGLKEFIHNIAFKYSLEVINLNELKGWIFHTVRFTYRGKQSQIQAAGREITRCINNQRYTFN